MQVCGCWLEAVGLGVSQSVRLRSAAAISLSDQFAVPVLDKGVTRGFPQGNTLWSAQEGAEAASQSKHSLRPMAGWINRGKGTDWVAGSLKIRVVTVRITALTRDQRKGMLVAIRI